MRTRADLLAQAIDVAALLGRPVGGHPIQAKLVKSSFGPRQKNRFAGVDRPPARERRAPVVCHLRNGAARPSSWELGGGAGNHGLPPGEPGPKPEHQMDGLVHRIPACSHPACVATARAYRRRLTQ